MKHVLTKEMQLYYEKIVTSINSVNKISATTRKQVFASLQTDPGIHQLLPYLVQFIIDKVFENCVFFWTVLNRLLCRSLPT